MNYNIVNTFIYNDTYLRIFGMEGYGGKVSFQVDFKISWSKKMRIL
jgi:hypothetical protein